MVLGLKQGLAELVAGPGSMSDSKRAFASIVQDGGVAEGQAFEEVWLVDTAHGRLRRKSFEVPAEPAPAAEKKAKR